MDALLKNLTAIIVLVAFAGLGYYLLKSDSLSPSYSNQSDILAKTAEFIENRRLLNQARLDYKVLDNPVFRSLNSYSTPIISAPVKRENPFDVVTPNQ